MSTTNGISNVRTASAPSSSAAAQQKISSIFNQIDSSGSGRITKAQFEQAFTKLSFPATVKSIGPEAVYSKLDPSGSGVVTKKDFIAGMESLMKSKSTQPTKQVQNESKPTSAPKSGEGNGVAQSAAPKVPVQSAGSPIGSKINITA